MNYLLKNLEILDINSPYNGELVDILIDNGVIIEVGSIDKPSDNTIDYHGCKCTLSLFDTCSFLTDPGFEHKEDANSISESALAGGFTDICLLPNTFPIVQSRGDVKNLRNNGVIVRFHSLAALSENTEGENLTEILDLDEAGAIAFTDGLKPIWNSELLLKALQYVSKFDGLVIQRPKDINLSRHMQMHEGDVSTILGMKGAPSLAEELMIKRDIDILKYVGGRLHFSQISSRGAVEIIRQAKKEGLRVTCDVNFHHLIFTHESLFDYDTNFKLDPPLREVEDREALIEGLKDDTIDAICSGHVPQDVESKQLEFDLAEFGAIGLQVVTAALSTYALQLESDLIFSKLSNGAKSIFNIKSSTIAVGEQANLNIFDPNMAWIFDDDICLSKSHNSPFLNKEMVGKTVGVFTQSELYQF
ncbi:MAG: dihydroorotase [Cyclobacteriaceae bacterium]|jgi:dihydroorotase